MLNTEARYVKSDEGSNPGDQQPFIEVLEECRWLETDIRSKTEQMIALKEMATKVTSALSDMKGGSRIKHDVMEHSVVSIVDLEAEISDDVCKLVQTQKQMLDELKKLTHPESRTILQLRYLNNKSWKEIATIMDCSLKTVYRKHKNALAELEEYEEKHQKRETA